MARALCGSLLDRVYESRLGLDMFIAIYYTTDISHIPGITLFFISPHIFEGGIIDTS